MKIAFCLFKYFPFGGLQRDFLRIATACYERGHQIVVYTTAWQGDKPEFIAINVLPANSMQNHTRCLSFVNQVKRQLRQDRCDLVVGFNKMPMLDVYYAADTCYDAKKRWHWQRFLPRHHTLKALEHSVFNTASTTEILVISPHAQQEFQTYYQTPPHRFHLLPPGVDKNRFQVQDRQGIRNEVRRSFNVSDNQILLLFVGSGFKTKGLDRALHAITSIPIQLRNQIKLLVVGQDKVQPFCKLAQQLNIKSQVEFLGPRADIANLMLGGDLLIHPAYNENTGTVLLEALMMGLPVLTTAACGYACHITNANAGVVLASPFQQEKLNAVLLHMLQSDKSTWRSNAIRYTRKHDIYSLVDHAALIIEQVGERRANLFG